MATEDDVIQASASETKGLTLTGRANLDVEVGPVLAAGASIRALQPSLLQVDAQVPEAHPATTDESGWQALIDDSEHRLAVALARLDENDGIVVSGQRIGYAHPDLELELIVDVDLTDLESNASGVMGFQRQPVPQPA